MATTYIYFEAQNDNEIETEELCFVCAVKKAVERGNTCTIKIQSTNYEYTQCDCCKDYIRCEISI